ncbi:MAG TPA: hypothetical protein VML92_05570 [Steroidobacteraceae bacterium]|nr:hypothetical protein [Steroidobacteraceae bacterium]
MTSFAFVIEPASQPRLAAWLLLLHAAIAFCPWFARCPAPLAAALSTLAIAGFYLNLAWVPGRHCRLQAIAVDGSRWRVRLAGAADWQPAALGAGTRAYRDCVLLDLRVTGRRAGWLLPRGAVPADSFRRLKARIRLSC